MEEQKKIHRRTPQERADAIDAKIAVHQDEIAVIEEKRSKAMEEFDGKVAAVREKIKGLEDKKKAILAPKPPRKTKKQKIQEVVNAAIKSGMSLEEISKKLSLDPKEETGTDEHGE